MDSVILVNETPTTAENWTEAGFKNADKLWTSMQNKMAEFITTLGGDATFYTHKNITARPKWNDVESYLKGTITFTELKRRLGC